MTPLPSTRCAPRRALWVLLALPALLGAVAAPAHAQRLPAPTSNIDTRWRAESGIAATIPGRSPLIDERWRAGNGIVPVIDGNGDDLIAYAASLSGADCGLSIDDARDDISVADPKIVSCAPKEDTDGNGVPDYFVNGFDLRRFVFAYDRSARSLYVLWRAEGMIGDPDGNLNPDNTLCPPLVPTFGDEPGIGSQENYQLRIDTDCNGAPDIIISVGGVLGSDQVTVQGTSIGATQLAYRVGSGGSGRDLELRVSDLTLPGVFVVRGNSNAAFDGLGEDISSEQGCVPNPLIDVEKSASVPSLCPGATVDFTITVTNTGGVDLTNITVVDVLDPGLVYQQTLANTCGGSVNVVGNQVTYGPFNLAVGATCSIVIRAGRTAACAGSQANNVRVEGTFQSPCFNDGEPVVVADVAAASVLCASVLCSISAPDTRVCPGETVEICGPVGNYTYLWSTGETTRCIVVGVGTYSLVVTDVATGCSSAGAGPCQVTVVEDPNPICTITAPDLSACPDETVELCGPVGPYTYVWTTGETTRCIDVGPGTYSLTLTSAAGCASTCTVTVAEEDCQPCLGVLIMDEETIDNDIKSIEAAGRSCGILPDRLVNDDRPREVGNLPLRWNTDCPGGIVTIPSGQLFDEGIFALPAILPWSLEAFVAGTVPQSQLDKILNVNPLQTPELQQLEGRSFVAVVYDSDISMNYGPTNGNLQGGRYGLFFFTVLDVIPPGSIPESGSSSSQWDLIVRVDPVPATYCLEQPFPVARIGDETESAVVGTSPAADREWAALRNRAVPNPFRSSLSYAYEVTGAERAVDIAVYDVAGRRVKSLVGAAQPAGRHTITWDGRDDHGARVPSGVYFVRAQVGSELARHRVVYLEP